MLHSLTQKDSIVAYAQEAASYNHNSYNDSKILKQGNSNAYAVSTIEMLASLSLRSGNLSLINLVDIKF